MTVRTIVPRFSLSKRRPISSKDPRRPAGHDQPAFHRMTRKRRPFAHQMHEARAKLHRRSLAPDGQKGKHPQPQEQRFADCHAHGQQPLPQLPRSRLQHRNGLRDPRAIGPRKDVIAQPKNQSEACRHNEKHRPRRRVPDHPRELRRLLVEHRKKQCPQSGQDRANERRAKRAPSAMGGFRIHGQQQDKVEAASPPLVDHG